MPTAHIFLGEAFKDHQSALQHTTHLAIGAHPDDLEVMAGEGILHAQTELDDHFYGVICTSGAGSVQTDGAPPLSDSQLVVQRQQEQERAARLGQYVGLTMLSFTSDEIKTGWNQNLIEQLTVLIERARPRVVYTHNLFDKHQTHVAVAAHVIEVLRRQSWKPQRFLGCEVWRGLDWLPDKQKVLLPITRPHLIGDLISCHASQTQGGKNYAEATIGRMAANATFFDAHVQDKVSHQLFAVDLLPLLENPAWSLQDFAQNQVNQLAQEIAASLTPFTRSE
jgi:LmbE family N-acetylglucosaminyl deacetylase